MFGHNEGGLPTPPEWVAIQKSELETLRQHQAKLEAELSELRSLDRHKDKDWAKWYGLYNQKCERVVELEARVKMLNDEIEGKGGHKELTKGLQYRISQLEQQLAQLQEENHALKVHMDQRSKGTDPLTAELRAELAQLQLEVGRYREALEFAKKSRTFEGPPKVAFYKVCDALDEIAAVAKQAISQQTPPLYSAVVELMEAAKRAIERYGSLDLSESVSAVENLIGKPGSKNV